LPTGAHPPIGAWAFGHVLTEVPMRVRFSRLQKYETCPAQYWYQYERRLKTENTPANLVFGSKLHKALTEHVKGHALGQFVDPVALFEQGWDQAMTDTAIEFSATQTPEDLR